MSRIDRRFETLRQRREGALLGYLMAGDPDPDSSRAYVRGLMEGGIDLLELGVPFSDPVADGPTIQAAGVRALRSGTTPATAFELVRQVRNGLPPGADELPIVLMTYYNPIFAMGEEAFLERCLEAGIDGVIVPDLPVEEADAWIDGARRFQVATVFLATPETDETRLGEIAQRSSGFLYLISRHGVTGAKSDLDAHLGELIEKTRAHLPQELPVAVGFGISTPDQVRAVVGAGAQGAIVGSALVDRIAQRIPPSELGQFVRRLKSGTRSE